MAEDGPSKDPKHVPEIPVCEKCGSNEHIHDGLCRVCRKSLLEEPEELRHGIAPPGRSARPKAPEVEPLHSPPWRHRGGG